MPDTPVGADVSICSPSCSQSIDEVSKQPDDDTIHYDRSASVSTNTPDPHHRCTTNQPLSTNTNTSSTPAPSSSSSTTACLPSSTTTRSRPRVYYVNGGGVRSKLPAIFAMTAVCDYDVIVVVETWLVPSIYDAELTPHGWLCFRKDRHDEADAVGVGGGVMILVRQDLCPTLISSDSTVEQVWVRLSLGDRSLYIGGV